jgi:hypothetical protein
MGKSVLEARGLLEGRIIRLLPGLLILSTRALLWPHA